MPEREREIQRQKLTDISQQWVKSFMTSKMALGKSIVSYIYIYTHPFFLENG